MGIFTKIFYLCMPRFSLFYMAAKATNPETAAG